MELTAIFQKQSRGYLGWLEQSPDTKVAEPTLEQARASLTESVARAIARGRIDAVLQKGVGMRERIII